MKKIYGVLILSVLTVFLTLSGSIAYAQHQTSITNNHLNKIYKLDDLMKVKINRHLAKNPLTEKLLPINAASYWLEHDEENGWDTTTGSWTNIGRKYYAYNADGTSKIQLQQLWDTTGNQWMHAYLMNYAYDSNQNLTEQVTQMWDTTKWVNAYRYQYAYNSSNQKTNSLTQTWFNNQWNDQVRTRYSYNNQDSLAETVQEGWLNNAWVNTQRHQYTYNNQGELLQELFQNWGGHWLDSERYQYTYSNGLMTQEVYQSWDMIQSQWVNSDKYSYTYDRNKNVTEELAQTWDGTQWVNDSRNQFTYNANNQWTLWVTQGWDSTASQWISIFQLKYTYDANNNPTEFLYQTRDTTNMASTIWINTLQVLSYYTTTRPDGVPTPIEKTVVNIPDKISLYQNYPNPFNPSTQIKYDLSKTQPVHLTIYDITGRKVAVLVNEKQSAGAHIITFNANGLSSGVYFYRLEAGDFVQTRKMVLIK